MTDENPCDVIPLLKEVESKLGRRAPESLLAWMRDAAHCGDGWADEVVSRGDSSSGLSGGISDRISGLKQEMRCLRCADVRILRQLVAVHEGIEAMRWLTEDRGALVSQCSSLTGSLSSLVTVDEPGPSVNPSRESPSPTWPEDLTETTSEESIGQRSSQNNEGDSNNNVLSPDSTEAWPSSLSSSKFYTASSNPATALLSAGSHKSQTPDLVAGLLQNLKGGAGTISRALHRSRKARNEVKADTSSFSLIQESGENLTASQNDIVEEEKGAHSKDDVLLGYDAQWCWVESQDDVTFL